MIRKYSLLYCCIFFLIFSAFAQPAKPKLIVGLVIDQMRWDYLYRYTELYGPNGFKRMIGQGYNCENTFIPYVPTYTAAGHSSIYTGGVPGITGIMGNFWFDKATNKVIYCTDDSTVSSVGNNSTAGKMSPQNLWTTTIADELRLSNNFQSKVIGISLKDRGAILTAGHSANAAYWYDDAIGKWITSSYYMKTLPAWVNVFNRRDLPGTYMNGDWKTLLPIEKYVQSTADDMPYESNIAGEKTVTFPHKLTQTGDQKYVAFKYTPFAATYTFDFARAAIENESLGNNTATDFLAISISSTDYMGHNFGPNSIEAADTYIRLDRDIALFLNYLDVKLGKGNYTMFLTADHGVAHIPAFLKSHKIPAGLFDDLEMTKGINSLVEQKFGIRNIILSVQNYQLYLNTAEIERQGKDAGIIKQSIIDFLHSNPLIVHAFEIARLESVTLAPAIKAMISNSYNPVRSGDIQFIIKPNYFDGYSKGTTHGLWNPYDSHIPLLWYGWGIRQGKTNREIYMTDIAPTLAALLKIQVPNGCIGKVIAEVLK